MATSSKQKISYKYTKEPSGKYDTPYYHCVSKYKNNKEKKKRKQRI